MERKRELFPDVLRIAATCAVVMLHTVTGTTDIHYTPGVEVRWPYYNLIVDYSSWAVPIFLIMSGYFFLDPKREMPLKKLYLKHCLRIVLAIYLFGVPFSLIEQIGGYHGFIWAMVPQALWCATRNLTWAHMWYLYAILILYAITPLLRLILPKIPKAVVLGLMGVLFTVTCVLPFINSVFRIALWNWTWMPLMYLAYYICGYYFAVSKREAKPWHVKLEIALIALLAVLEILIRVVLERGNGPGYSYPLTVIMSLLIFALGKDLGALGKRKRQTADAEDKPGKGAKVIAFFADLCFGIYLVHPVFLNFFYKFIDVSLYDYPFVPGLIVFYLLTLAGAVVLSFLLRLIPPMKKYVL